MSQTACTTLLALLVAACGDASAPQADRTETAAGPLRIAAVNYPLAYLAERIGGDEVVVRLPLPADVDPAFWEPTPADIAGFQEADVILRNGAGYAAWTRTATLPFSRVVDTARGFADRLIVLTDAVTHSHGPAGEHAHGGTAFTTWLDPELAIVQARAIRDALAARRPTAMASFDTALASLENDLQALDRRLAAAVAQTPGRAVLFSHPVYDYLTRRYDIHGHSLHWEPDRAPTEDQLGELEEIASDQGAHWMIWESEPLPASVDALRARGIESVVFDPCGNRPNTGDLLSVMASNAAGLERVFGAGD